MTSYRTSCASGADADEEVDVLRDGYDVAGDALVPELPVWSGMSVKRRIEKDRGARAILIGDDAPLRTELLQKMDRSWYERRFDEDRYSKPLLIVYDDREGTELSGRRGSSVQASYLMNQADEVNRMLLYPYGQGIMVCFPACSFSRDGEPTREMESALEEALNKGADILYDATGCVFDGRRYPKAAFLPGDVHASYSKEEGHMLTLERRTDGGEIYELAVFATLMNELVYTVLNAYPGLRARYGESYFVEHRFNLDGLAFLMKLISLGNLSSFRAPYPFKNWDNHCIAELPDKNSLTFKLSDEGALRDEPNITALERSVRTFNDLVAIWNKAGNGVFELTCPLADPEYTYWRGIESSYAKMADMLGIRPLIEARCQGVSMDDLFAGAAS